MRLRAWGVSLAAALLLALAGGAAVLAAQPAAYCSIPAAGATPSWAFHAGVPIQTARGTYAHGHGMISGQHASGVICQVDRVAGAGDRQIILTVVSPLISLHHAVTEHGQLGNALALRVRVTSSTDTACKAGTVGEVTLFATYNGIHDDRVQFAFPRGCTDHRRDYSGTGVVALVPR